jgi:hypothetical protein
MPCTVTWGRLCSLPDIFIAPPDRQGYQWQHVKENKERLRESKEITSQRFSKNNYLTSLRKLSPRKQGIKMREEITGNQKQDIPTKKIQKSIL